MVPAPVTTLAVAVETTGTGTETASSKSGADWAADSSAGRRGHHRVAEREARAGAGVGARSRVGCAVKVPAEVTPTA